jgi:hypothetical protein
MGYLVKKNTACKNSMYPKLDAAGRVCSELSRGRERRLKHAEFTDQFAVFINVIMSSGRVNRLE